MDKIRAQAVLDLINTTNTRNNIEDDIENISDSDILTSVYSQCFIFDDYDTKKFKIDTSSYGASIIESFLYIYSEAFDDESDSQRVFITDIVEVKIDRLLKDDIEKVLINKNDYDGYVHGDLNKLTYKDKDGAISQISVNKVKSIKILEE